MWTLRAGFGAFCDVMEWIVLTVHSREGISLAMHIHWEADEREVFGCSRRFASGLNFKT